MMGASTSNTCTIVEMKKNRDEINIHETKLAHVYVYELWLLVSNIKKKAEKVFELAVVPEDPNMNFVGVKPELHSYISSLLCDATNIKKLIAMPLNKGSRSAKLFEFQKARCKMLLEIVGNIDITEILNVKIRNTLEHFDEYLDEANAELTLNPMPAGTEGRSAAAFNVALSRWDTISPRVYPIRLYIAAERKFYNMKWSVDIGKIYEQSNMLRERLINSYGFDHPEKGNGLLFLIHS